MTKYKKLDPNGRSAECWYIFIDKGILDKNDIPYESLNSDLLKKLPKNKYIEYVSPSYLGEILLWFGIAIICLPNLSGFQYFSLISPVFVYLLLTRISGINLLEDYAEQKWGKSELYQDYKKATPVLFPFKK